MRHVLRLTLPILIAAALPARAAERPIVVELFTSQSCSSCPPAEALLGALAQEGPGVLPLAFHVTYWNHLDWRDPYALPEATARQDAYAGPLGDGIYTPQAVIDGRRGVVGSQAAEVRAAIARARTEAGRAIPVTLTREGPDLVVRLGEGAGSGRVVLVGFDPIHTTRIARGENAGRTLVQVNVVRSIRAIGSITGARQTLTVGRPAGEAAAILVQAPDGRILGAGRVDG